MNLTVIVQDSLQIICVFSHFAIVPLAEHSCNQSERLFCPSNLNDVFSMNAPASIKYPRRDRRHAIRAQCSATGLGIRLKILLPPSTKDAVFAA